MVLPSQPHLDPRAAEFIRQEMRRSYTEDGDPPIELSVDDLVTVVMDTRRRVRSISIHDKTLGTNETAQVERALVTAINQAMTEATRRSAERLALALEQASSYVGPDA